MTNVNPNYIAYLNSLQKSYEDAITDFNLELECIGKMLDCNDKSISEKRTDAQSATNKFSEELPGLMQVMTYSEDKAEVIQASNRLAYLGRRVNETNLEVAELEADNAIRSIIIRMVQFLIITKACVRPYYTMENGQITKPITVKLSENETAFLREKQ